MNKKHVNSFILFMSSKPYCRLLSSFSAMSVRQRRSREMLLARMPLAAGSDNRQLYSQAIVVCESVGDFGNFNFHATETRRHLIFMF